MTKQNPNEWIHGLTTEDIRQYAELSPEKPRDFRIGSLDSDVATYEKDKAEIGERLNGLLNIFGIGITDWQGRVLRAEGTYGTGSASAGNQIYKPIDIKRLARGRKLGEYFMDQAWWAIPFESDEDEVGRFNLSLALENDLVANLKAHGEQRIFRYYIDPNTRQKLEGSDKDLEEQSMKGEVDTDIDVGFALTFIASFTRSNPSNS